jgi:hypothetical protein
MVPTPAESRKGWLRDVGDAAWFSGIGSRGTEAGNSGLPNGNLAIRVR